MGFRSTDMLRQMAEHCQRQYASNLADDKAYAVRLRADRQFDFEKPASIRSRADELRLHRLDEITQPRGSGWRDFTGSVTLGFSEQEVRAFYTV